MATAELVQAPEQDTDLEELLEFARQIRCQLTIRQITKQIVDEQNALRLGEGNNY